MQFDLTLFTNPAIMAAIAYPIATWLARSVLPRWFNWHLNPTWLAVGVSLALFVVGGTLPQDSLSGLLDIINIIVGVLTALGVSVGVQAVAIRSQGDVYRAADSRPLWWEGWI